MRGKTVQAVTVLIALCVSLALLLTPPVSLGQIYTCRTTVNGTAVLHDPSYLQTTASTYFAYAPAEGQNHSPLSRADSWMQQFIIDTSGELFWIVTMNTAGHVLPSTRVYRFLLEISSIGGGIVGNPFLEADDPHEIPTWIGDEFYGNGSCSFTHGAPTTDGLLLGVWDKTKVEPTKPLCVSIGEKRPGDVNSNLFAYFVGNVSNSNVDFQMESPDSIFGMESCCWTIPVSFSFAAPSSGDSILEKSTAAISWTVVTGLPMGTLSLYLFKNGTQVSTLISGIPRSQTSLAWDLSVAAAPPGDQYQIKVSDDSQPTISFGFSSEFSIFAPILVLESVNQPWYPGVETTPIQWATNPAPNSASSLVTLSLWQDEAQVLVIAADLPTTSLTFSWTPSSSLSPGEYQLLASYPFEPHIAHANVSVTVAQVPILDLQPVDQLWYPGVETPPIQWATNPAPISASSLVTLSLWQDDAQVLVIATDLPTTSSNFSWTPSLSLSPGEYQLRTSYPSEPYIAHANVSVTVAQVPILDLQPLDQPWYPSVETPPIQWATNPAPISASSLVTLSLWQDDAQVLVIAADLPHTSSNFSWTPSSSLSPGEYQLRVSYPSDPYIAHANVSVTVAQVELWVSMPSTSDCWILGQEPLSLSWWPFPNFFPADPAVDQVAVQLLTLNMTTEVVLNTSSAAQNLSLREASFTFDPSSLSAQFKYSLRVLSTVWGVMNQTATFCVSRNFWLHVSVQETCVPSTGTQIASWSSNVLPTSLQASVTVFSSLTQDPDSAYVPTILLGSSFPVTSQSTIVSPASLDPALFHKIEVSISISHPDPILLVNSSIPFCVLGTTTLQVIEPALGDTIYSSFSTAIKWMSDSNSARGVPLTVGIRLLSDGVTVSDIIQETFNQNGETSFTWTVPLLQKGGDNFTLVIYDTEFPSVIYASSSGFSIAPSMLELLLPPPLPDAEEPSTGPAVWFGGYPARIGWDANAPPLGSVLASLGSEIRPDTVPIRLNADQPVITSKNFAWRVPPSTELEPGDSYFVRLVSSVAPQFVATSVPISIREPIVSLEDTLPAPSSNHSESGADAPVSLPTLLIGSNVTIRWRTSVTQEYLQRFRLLLLNSTDNIVQVVEENHWNVFSLSSVALLQQDMSSTIPALSDAYSVHFLLEDGHPVGTGFRFVVEDQDYPDVFGASARFQIRNIQMDSSSTSSSCGSLFLLLLVGLDPLGKSRCRPGDRVVLLVVPGCQTSPEEKVAGNGGGKSCSALVSNECRARLAWERPSFEFSSLE